MAHRGIDRFDDPGDPEDFVEDEEHDDLDPIDDEDLDAPDLDVGEDFDPDQDPDEG